MTNCSEELGRVAAGRTGVNFAVVVTAERAGFYKPHPLPYQIALDALGVAPERCLFVAGSPYDLFGTAKLGMPAYWHDRIGMTAPTGCPDADVARENADPAARRSGLGGAAEFGIRGCFLPRAQTAAISERRF